MTRPVHEPLKTLDPPIVAAFADQAKANAPGEKRTRSASGGEKAVKQARFDLIPQKPLWELAELYGFGAEKYPDGNWRKGYEWSKSIAALQRHFSLWMQGEEMDDGPGGSGLPHLTAVAWHAFTLREWAKTHPEYDDRHK